MKTPLPMPARPASARIMPGQRQGTGTGSRVVVSRDLRVTFPSVQPHLFRTAVPVADSSGPDGVLEGVQQVNKSALAACLMFFVANAGAAAVTSAARSASSGMQASPAVQKHKQKRVSARHRRYPTGDLRFCLELKSNEAIIRCAETGKK